MRFSRPLRCQKRDRKGRRENTARSGWGDMSDVNRRAFVKAAVAAAASAAAGSSAACAPESATRNAAALPHAMLLALAQVVLPQELGADGTARVVSGFEAWLAGYRPAAEVTHGYGTGDLEYTPANPGPGWAAQLQALELEAQARHGAPFASLGEEQRADMIRQQLARERGDRLPDPVQARHVAIGLLAWWAQTPEATNLCYRARIDPNTCRPLSVQGSRPASLAGS